MSAIRSKLTYSNVVSTVLAFVVLGGGVAWAHGLIDTADLRDEAVTNRKMKKRTVGTSRLKRETVRTLRGARGFALVDPFGEVGSNDPAFVGPHRGFRRVRQIDTATYCLLPTFKATRPVVATAAGPELNAFPTVAEVGIGDPALGCTGREVRVRVRTPGGSERSDGWFTVIAA